MKIIRPTKIFLEGGETKGEYNPFKKTYQNVRVYKKWNNEDNPFNITPIWNDLNLSNHSGLDTERPYPSYGSLIISIYVTNVNMDSGVQIRPAICKCYWWDDDEVEFIENDENTELLNIFMNAIGLDYKENPHSEDSVKLAEKLCELDENFRKLFNVYFKIAEIPDDIDELKEKYFALQDEYVELKKELDFKSKMLKILKNEGDKTWHFLYKILNKEDMNSYRELRKQILDQWVPHA